MPHTKNEIIQLAFHLHELLYLLLTHRVRVADVGHARALAGADPGDGPALARHHNHLGTDVVAHQQSVQKN